MEDLAIRMWDSPPIDADLSQLIEKCIDDDILERPSLEELTNLCKAGVARTQLDYIAQGEKTFMAESDVRLRAYIKKYIFDAEIVPNTNSVSI